MTYLPLTLSAACPGVCAGDLGMAYQVADVGCRECGDRIWAGQAARMGGPQAASNRLIHSVSRCQSWGRCRVIWPRPWRAVRAATWIRSRRSVAARALRR